MRSFLFRTRLQCIFPSINRGVISLQRVRFLKFCIWSAYPDASDCLPFAFFPGCLFSGKRNHFFASCPCYTLFNSSSKTVIFEKYCTLIRTDHFSKHSVSVVRIFPDASVCFCFSYKIAFFIIEVFYSFCDKPAMTTLIDISFLFQVNSGSFQPASRSVDAVTLIFGSIDISCLIKHPET